mmetsp:Transcript_34731/g.109383  ORF Transcript_34731/g.109383 Transcript_34731/m.109383 type:complete len:215 (-) Transcript_34731:225-869(-)
MNVSVHSSTELGSVGARLSAAPLFSSASAPVRHFSIWRITRSISCGVLPVWSWSRPRCRTESHSWRLPPATARLPTHMAGPVACLDSLRSLNSRTPLLSGSRECVQATQADDAKHPQCISPGRHLSTRLIGSIKSDPMTVLQPHETGSCALISVQDGQRHVRHLLAASRGCPPGHMLQPRVDVLVVCGSHKTTLVWVGAGRLSVGGTPVQMLHG